MNTMWGRRSLTLPAVVLAAALCITFYLPIVLLCFLISVIPNLRTLPHVWTFVCGYLIYDCLGVSRLTWVWIRYRSHPNWILKNRLVQIWWAAALLRMGARIFRLKFDVTGQEALHGPSAILCVRHASIGDTVLPLVFFARPRGNEGMRYLIKQELRLSPSLDIGAHRLSTLFVDRSGDNTAQELSRIANMAATTPNDESIMVYPEGTRVTESKRSQLRTNQPDLAKQLDRWPNLLPPRLGGVTTLLANNPAKDVVFMAHTGFEGCANLTELLSGDWRHITVHIHLWRIAYRDIPTDHADFLYAQWDRMQDTVARFQES